MKSLISVALVASFALAGCASTDPMSAADLEYRLPRTDANVVLTLTLTSCAPWRANADIVVAAQPGAQDTVYVVPGKALASDTIKRTVKVTLKDGVITGINSSNADRTAQIIGSVIKTAVALAPLFEVMKVSEVPCTDDVKATLARVAVIKGRISRLRALLATEGGTEADAAKIDTLAKELAALQTGVLQVQATGTIKIDRDKFKEGISYFVDFPHISFVKWFGPKTDTLMKPGDNLNKAIGLSWSATAIPIKREPIGDDAPKPERACGRSLPMPSPELLKLALVGTDGKLVTPTTSAELVMPVAQLKDPKQLCIDAGFGENREVDLAFDSYGQTTLFNWISDATGENVSSAIAGYAPDIAKLDTTLNPSASDVQNAETTRLQNLQKYNQMKACEAILEAGGYTCPK